MLAVGIAAVLAASAAYNAGVVLQALDARKEPAECGLRLALLARLLRRRRWLAGTALTILAFPLQVVAYSNAPLDIVQPLLAVGLVVVLVLGSRLMGDAARPSHYAAVAAIIAGVAIMAAAGPDHRQPDRGGIAQLTVMAVLAIGIAAPYVLRDRRWRGAALLTASTGVAFAWGDLATKLFGDGVNGGRVGVAAFWLVVVGVSAVVGTLSLMTAFQEADVRRVVPGTFAVEAVLPVVLAPLLLQHDGGFTASDLAPIAIGLALVVAGIVVLAGSAQVAWAMAAASTRATGKLSASEASRARAPSGSVRGPAPPTRTGRASASGSSPQLGAGAARLAPHRTRPRP
jgi:drug/metabolite transporter (DMT)-like permease